jgi:hypothetical protein
MMLAIAFWSVHISRKQRAGDGVFRASDSCRATDSADTSPGDCRARPPPEEIE